MPCGGIYLTELDGKYLPGAQPQCFVCGEEPTLNWHETIAKGTDPIKVYFCEEWDCWVHRECVHFFLTTAEGAVVLKHGHAVYIEEEENVGASMRPEAWPSFKDGARRDRLDETG